MTAQPIEYALPGPQHPAKTFRAIRQALPAGQRQAFNDAVGTVDLSDLAAVAVLRDKWWVRAVLAQDDDLRADREACLAVSVDIRLLTCVGGPFPRQS